VAVLRLAVMPRLDPSISGRMRRGIPSPVWERGRGEGRTVIALAVSLQLRRPTLRLDDRGRALTPAPLPSGRGVPRALWQRLRASSTGDCHENLSPVFAARLSSLDLIPEGQPSGGVPMAGGGSAPAGGVTIHSREASGTALGVKRPLREELAGRLGGCNRRPGPTTRNGRPRSHPMPDSGSVVIRARRRPTAYGTGRPSAR